MELLRKLQSIIASDPERMRVLRYVQALQLPDCWVAAGFVRNCVWDCMHQRFPSPLTGDIDVIWHDPLHATPERDATLTALLLAQDSTLAWSVKNQARMHERNGDRPYLSSSDAMRHWPETATAVGVRLDRQACIEVNTPFGLEDLFGLTVRPTERFATRKQPIYLERVRSKAWQTRWPQLDIRVSS